MKSLCLLFSLVPSVGAQINTGLAWDPSAPGWNIHWNSTPGLYYAVEKTHDLQAWTLLESGILAESASLERSLPEESSFPVFYRVLEDAFVDPATPADAQPVLNVPTGDDWVLEFSDEFNFLDPSKWNVTVSTKTRSPRWDKGIQRWFWKEENVSVENGELVFKVTKPNSTTMYCGSVDSRGIYEPLYGFMEARIQIAPVVNAIHTAFWTQGQNMNNVDNSGADGAEVDIVETPWADERGQTVIHWDGYGANKKSKTNRWSAPGLHTGYHTFSMHWTESFIDIFYDGVFKWRYEGVGIPQVREWLWLSVGASFGDGDFQNGTYPSYAYVDYVRVWRSETAGTSQ
ncbi:glycoside hydrolase family 16 protein [Puniceicoccales bacterium CK1056]|uniref:Glycoside hydrolase family 16 protein n=1 Tax=Oceanipulchritudo coccoides TaxID=2706888 RepID=A0A6B2LYW8_9BACT|nr:glycoside hydrolase family 16 protein [Oceanipulchritudo coccoides]NDV61239.1 glycoside hydrolase family 16 protein [Oceanipulchritudo coccoides]